MALDYRSDPLPERTDTEQARRRAGFTVSAWAVGFFVFVFAVVVPVASYKPRYASGAEAGLAWVALLLAVVYVSYAGLKVWQQMQTFAPAMDIEARWSQVLRSCGLARDGVQPQVRLLQGDMGRNEVAVKLPDGARPEDLEAQASAIALAWEVPAVHLEQRPGGWFLVRLLPDLPMPAVIPTPPVEREKYRLPVPRSWAEYLKNLPVGELVDHTARDYFNADMVWLTGGGPDGVDPKYVLPRPYALPLAGGHLLIGGKSGAGKSGVINAIVAALKPAVAHGVVRLVAIDPKRMELAFNKGYYYRYVADGEAIYDLLGELVELMEKRQDDVAEMARDALVTKEFPTYVILVDEMMAIMTLDEDAKRAKKTLQRLNKLLTQGRAAGFIVVSATQEVTKENIKNRSLYTSGWALRMDDSNYDLVLGPGCRTVYGVKKVKRDMPGAGWIWDDDGDGFALVQSNHITDAMLRGDRELWREGEYLGPLSDFPVPWKQGPRPDPGGGIRQDDPGAASAWDRPLVMPDGVAAFVPASHPPRSSTAERNQAAQEAAAADGLTYQGFYPAGATEPEAAAYSQGTDEGVAA